MPVTSYNVQGKMVYMKVIRILGGQMINYTICATNTLALRIYFFVKYVNLIDRHELLN